MGFFGHFFLPEEAAGFLGGLLCCFEGAEGRVESADFSVRGSGGHLFRVAAYWILQPTLPLDTIVVFSRPTMVDLKGG